MPIFWLSYSDHGRPAGDWHLHVIASAADQDAVVAIARGMGTVAEVSVGDLDGCDDVPLAFVNRVLADADVDAMEASMLAGRV